MRRTCALAAAIGFCAALTACGPDRELVASAVNHQCSMLAAAAALEESPGDADALARLESARGMYETVIGGDSAIEEAVTKAIEENGCPGDSAE